MAFKLYISPSDQNRNIGVGSYGSEEQRMNALADALERELFANEIPYIRGGRTMEIEDRMTESDNLGCTHYLALHSDAGGGHGPTAFFYSDAGCKFADAIMSEVLKIVPDNNRAQNVRQNKNLMETRGQKAIAVLLETGFHDCPKEAAYIAEHPDEYAAAICKGICKYLGKAHKKPERKIYRVQVGAFAEYKNAAALLEKFQKMGYAGFIVTKEL